MGENVTCVAVSASRRDIVDSGAVTALRRLALGPVLLLEIECGRSFPVPFRCSTAALGRFSGDVETDAAESASAPRLLRERLKAPINLNAVGPGGIWIGGVGVSMLVRGECVCATYATSDMGLVGGIWRSSAGFEYALPGFPFSAY